MYVDPGNADGVDADRSQILYRKSRGDGVERGIALPQIAGRPEPMSSGDIYDSVTDSATVRNVYATSTYRRARGKNRDGTGREARIGSPDDSSPIPACR